MMIGNLLRALFHLSPAFIFGAGYKSLAVAALLFVAVCYIKVKKLQAQIADAGPGADTSSIKSALKRWQAFTFI